jgi:LmbE family N-acetylglucosaminyl deacetylase
VTEDRLLVIGAHPDDCEIRAAGLSKRWVDKGGVVRWLSMTDGSSGHQTLGGANLVVQRHKEADAAAAIVGAESVFLDIPDGTLVPSLENRVRLIRQIREFRPDVIAGPRPWDYHPDHRYTGQLMQDATYMIQVPNIVPNVPALRTAPVVLYVWDPFVTPIPLRGDLVFDIDDIYETKARVIAAHASQVFDWLPWVDGITDQVPADLERDGLDFVKRRYVDRLGSREPYRAALVARYGAERAAKVRSVEVFEVCEYGAPLTPDLSRRLFDF